LLAAAAGPRFGILLIRVALAGTMEAHGDFNQEIIARGYASGPERAAQVSDLRAATRMAALMHVAGFAMIAAGIAGLFLAG
jgi:hypothetical protein